MSKYQLTYPLKLFRQFLPITKALGIFVSVASGCGCSAGARNLEGTSWRLTGWTVKSLNPARFPITAEFLKGMISGNSAINAYSGPIKIGPGNAFSVGFVAGTKMAGTGPAMRAEITYLELLQEATSYRTLNNTLILSDRRGRKSLTFESIMPSPGVLLAAPPNGAPITSPHAATTH